ncbi:MAG: two-component regulator propeller domain-containing protein [Bacteroidota bacterium]
MYSTANSQKIKFRIFDIESGLPNNFINSINQDKNGYLWIGTSEGLTRYNGLNFDQFKTIDGLSDDFISATFIDKKGIIWFGHSDGNVSIYKSGKFKTIVSGLSTIITGITEDNTGNKWIATQTEGVYRIDKETYAVEIFEIPDQIISSIVCLKNNKILFGTNNGLFESNIVGNKLTEIKPVIDFPAFNVTSVIKKNNQNGVWATTSEAGLYALSISNNGKITTAKVGDNIGLSLENAQSVFEDNEQNLWVSTFGTGICKLSYSSESEKFIDIKFYNEENGLISNYVKTIFQDREDNIWIGTYGFGLAQRMKESFLFYSFDENKYSNNIFSILIDNKDYLWLGTANGLLQMDLRTEKIIEFYNSNNKFINDNVTALCSDTSGNIYIGTSRNGIYYFKTEDKEFEKIEIGGDALMKMINKLEIYNDTIWAATNGGVLKIHKKLISVINTSNGLNHNVVNDLAFDETMSKLYVASISNMFTYIFKDSVINKPIGSANDLYEFVSVDIDNNGSKWLATAEYGIINWDTLLAVNFTTDMGLKSNYCYFIISDNQNNIWVGHRGGLSVLVQDNNEIKTYGINDGISSNLNKNAAFLDQKGNLWFGTNKGLIKHIPETRKKITISPTLNMVSVKINNREYDFSEKIKMKYGNYQFLFNFIGISLKDPLGVTYRYKLEGYDPDYITTNSNKNIIYNNLTDGDYVFKIFACNSEGICTKQPVTVHILIDKPFWKKTWVILSIIFIIVFVTFLIVYARFRNLKRRERLLENELQKRTKEIIEKNEELNDKNKSITDSILYAESLQTAILPDINLIQTYFPESFIFYKPKDIVSGDFYRFEKIKDENKFLIFCSDCTGHGVPAAFMSMIGHTLIKDITSSKTYNHTGEILNQLNIEIRKILRHNPSYKRDDGMDIVVCEIDFDNNKIAFSSAQRPIVLFKNNKLIWQKGSQFSIGGGRDVQSPFEEISFKLDKNDTIYLFTDGYIDQFGGPDGKKFKSSGFRKLLSDIYDLPMSEQENIIKETFNNWMSIRSEDENFFDQTDDILIIGIKIL